MRQSPSPSCPSPKRLPPWLPARSLGFAMVALTLVLCGCAPHAQEDRGVRTSLLGHGHFIHPTGIAALADRGVLLVSGYGDGSLWQVDAATGRARRVQPPRFEGRRRALRVLADEVRDRIWVLAPDAISLYAMSSLASPDGGAAHGVALRTVRLDIAAASLVHCMSDIALGPAGEVYVSDPRRPRVTVVRADGTARGIEFEGPARQGISAIAVLAPEVLLAASAATGEFGILSLASGAWIPVLLDQPLEGACGMAVADHDDGIFTILVTRSHAGGLHRMVLDLDAGTAVVTAAVRALANAPTVGVSIVDGTAHVPMSQITLHPDFGGGTVPPLRSAVAAVRLDGR